MENNTTTWIHPFEKAGLGKAPFQCVGFTVKKYQACADAPVQPGDSCDFCGTGIMNVFEIQSADGRRFVVGIDCVEKTGDTSLGAAARQAAKAERNKAIREEYQARMMERAKQAPTFLENNPGLAAALACGHKITDDLSANLAKWGTLSERQIELAFKLYSETFAPAKREERNTAAPVGPRRTVRGRVISTKLHEGYMGRKQLRMTVKVETIGPDANYVWLCWGTVPSEIEGFKFGTGLRGAEIEFTASLEAGNDPHFAFFKRPTKARIIEAAPSEE